MPKSLKDISLGRMLRDTAKEGAPTYCPEIDKNDRLREEFSKLSAALGLDGEKVFSPGEAVTERTERSCSDCSPDARRSGNPTSEAILRKHLAKTCTSLETPIMKKPLISMRVFLLKGRQFLINPETERVFQVRQLKKLKEGDPIFFQRICQVIWSDRSESHSDPIYSHWTFVNMCEDYVTISGDPEQL